MLKRKLRLPLWPGTELPICFCGKRMDQYGDHCLSCQRHCKTPMHNSIRDGLARLLEEILPLVRLIGSPTAIQKEPRGIIKALPNTRPFDFSILFDHLLDESAWRTPLFKLGVDVTVVSSAPLPHPDTSVARKNEIKLRLREGERKKFQRRGRSDKDTQMTLSGDDITGEYLRQNMALLPFAVSPHGRLGSLAEQFLYGSDPLPVPDFAADRPNALAAARICRSRVVPHGILERANSIWRHEHPDSSFSGSYKAMDPKTHFDQQLGLVISTAISSHLLRAHAKNQSKHPMQCTGADVLADLAEEGDLDDSLPIGCLGTRFWEAPSLA
jgi:hypothetical protein